MADLLFMLQMLPALCRCCEGNPGLCDCVGAWCDGCWHCEIHCACHRDCEPGGYFGDARYDLESEEARILNSKYEC